MIIIKHRSKGGFVSSRGVTYAGEAEKRLWDVLGVAWAAPAVFRRGAVKAGESPGVGQSTEEQPPSGGREVGSCGNSWKPESWRKSSLERPGGKVFGFYFEVE